MNKGLPGFLILPVSILLFNSILSCNNCAPVELGSYYLSDEQRSWISYQNSQVIFKNQNDSAQTFTYAEAQGYLQGNSYGCSKCNQIHFHNEFLAFIFSSDSFPNLLTLTLNAAAPLSCVINNGSLEIDGADFSPLLQITLPDSLLLSYNTSYKDSILLNGSHFTSVYYTSYSYTGNNLIESVYFNKKLGVVAFDTKSGDLWVRLQ